jgi:anti-sigma regulatory factor (Ser/Thr protein kinase)
VSETAGAPESTPAATRRRHAARDAVSDRPPPRGGLVAEWSFPAEAGAVRNARAVVRATLNEWGLNAVADVAVLLVSELVTNSLRHARGPIGVRLERRGSDVLRVEVSDPVPDLPLSRTAALDDEGGRGLQLVARTSLRWGTRHSRAGKTVWFELCLAG